MKRSVFFGLFLVFCVPLWCPPLWSPPLWAEDRTHPASSLLSAVADAEQALGSGEPQMAESSYRSALLEGLLLRATLSAADEDLHTALTDFEHAQRVATEVRRPLLGQAHIQLRLGEARQGVQLLQRLVSIRPQDPENRRLLAQALIADGRPAEAAQELEEALLLNPGDPELAFNLATGSLRLERLDRAAELFTQVLQARPSARTHLLIGRIYSDHRRFDLAREQLLAALDLDPQIPRAQYYLGAIALRQSGRDGLEEAVGRFDQALRQDPEDPQTNLYQGTSLVALRRFEEAIAPLQKAATEEGARIDALRFLGSAYLGLDHSEDAVRTLREALEAAEAAGEAARDRSLASIHYQLGTALRRIGKIAVAGEHFQAAERYSALLVEGERESLTAFLSESLESEATPEHLSQIFQSPLGASLRGLNPEQRLELRRIIDTELTRSYMNLGILRLQAQSEEQAVRAARLLAEAEKITPDFPGLSRTLGVALFNAGRFEEAVAPLSRSLRQSETPDAELRRMTALAYLNAERPAEAAALLRDDPNLLAEPSLLYAYSLALVRSGRADEASSAFDTLLAQNAEWPELHVLLGQASAQKNDYPAAIASLEHALKLRNDVLEAHAALGTIYLRQGELEKAETELRAELDIAAGDLRTRYLLATVLDLNRQPEKAERELLRVLEEAPEFADARYLLGKILLARGEAGQAAAHLEAAAQASPEDPNIYYQLGQAKQRLGEAEAATRHFATYRELKRKEREGGS